MKHLPLIDMSKVRSNVIKRLGQELGLRDIGSIFCRSAYLVQSSVSQVEVPVELHLASEFTKPVEIRMRLFQRVDNGDVTPKLC